MEAHEIKIGAIYRCKGGWYRQPTNFEERWGLTEVAYRLGRTPKLEKGRSIGPLQWFSRTALECVRQPA